MLKSVFKQSKLPDEILIADDGSGEETRELIEKYQTEKSIPIHHVWHEDEGFRVSKIRNKAIKQSSGDYIIQIDGDCFLDKNFVKDHLSLKEKRCFISGSRVLLSKETTKKAIENQNIKFGFLSRGITNRFNTLSFPFANFLLKKKNEPIEKLIYQIRGCNMSFWREDLIEINGYEEKMEGWGREDSELVLRLLKKGLYLKRIKLAAVQYHLWHQENDRSNFEKNHEMMMESLNRKDFKAIKGIE